MRKFHRIKATAETTPSLFTERVRARRTSKLDGLQARLHRGNRADILCGRPTCRGKLGALDEVLRAEWHPQGWATVRVPRGFIPDKHRGGLWRRSKRPPRRPAFMYPHNASGSLDGSIALAIPLGDSQVVAPPFRIECAECGFVSIVSWEGLGLLPAE